MAEQRLHAAIAAHRFGLGEANCDVVGDDALGWLAAQIGAADAPKGDGLAGAVEALRRHEEFVRERRQQRRASPSVLDAMQETAPDMHRGHTPDARPAEQQFAEHFRAIVQADLRSRLLTATASARPFAERLVWFWANHFTVSNAKASARALVGSFEREAIRPHIAGSFEQLLHAAMTHAAMLRYLDNHLSAGPNSRLVARLARRDGDAPRIAGLNENLAREVLELHTLGAAHKAGRYGPWGGYTQADVTAFARVLTGWRVPLALRGDEATLFDAAWHEPGPKLVLGKRYREGPDALPELLRDLARHPSTARFVCCKLAAHFVADDPAPALVDRLAAAWRRSDGDLPSVYRELIVAPEAWRAAPAKLKSPEEFVVSSARLLGLGNERLANVALAGIAMLGQRVHAAPSPAGWPDRADEWLGPDALWKRVEWATRVADRVGRGVDARALARASLGPLAGAPTLAQLDRAADAPQALALLLLAPEFQRR